MIRDSRLIFEQYLNSKPISHWYGNNEIFDSFWVEFGEILSAYGEHEVHLRAEENVEYGIEYLKEIISKFLAEYKNIDRDKLYTETIYALNNDPYIKEMIDEVDPRNSDYNSVIYKRFLDMIERAFLRKF